MADETPDTMVITATRPSTGFTIQVVLPVEIVQMLDWIAANVPDLIDPEKKRYLHAANVIYKDCIDLLVPGWAMRYKDGVTAQLKATMDQQQKAIDDALALGISNLQVTE